MSEGVNERAYRPGERVAMGPPLNNALVGLLAGMVASANNVVVVHGTHSYRLSDENVPAAALHALARFVVAEIRKVAPAVPVRQRARTTSDGK